MDVFSLVMRLKEEGAQQVKASVDKLNRSFDEGAKKGGLYDATIGSLSNQMKTLAGGFALATVIAKITTETSDAEFAAAQLNAALKSTQGVAGQSAEALNQHAQALAAVSTFDDDAITGAQALLLTFTKIHGDTFPKATQAIVDMATAMQTDLKSATIQVGKALNDPILGVSALARAGVQFTEAQKEVIAKLVETGKVAEAQTIILKELETQFGGSAAAAANTFGGALDRLRNSLGNLLTLSGDNANMFTRLINTLVSGIDRLNNAVTLKKTDLTGIWWLDAMRGAQAPGTVAKDLTSQTQQVGKSLTDVLNEQIQAHQLQIKQIMQLAEVKSLDAAQTKILRDEAARLTAEMNRQGLSMQGQYEAGKKLLEIQKALAPKGTAKKPLKLAEVSDIGSNRGIAMGGIPLMDTLVQKVAPVKLPEEIKSAVRNIPKQMEPEFMAGWQETTDRMADFAGNLLVDSLAAAFENLASVGGTIKSAFSVLTSGLLSGLGSMLIEFGRYAILTGKLMGKLQQSLQSFSPQGQIAAGLAMIALGGILRGAASRTFASPAGGGGGGGGGGSVGAMMTNTSFGLPTQYYGPTAAGSANTIERINPVNVTIIGTNDPAAQRQMQELMRNAQRRGNA